MSTIIKEKKYSRLCLRWPQ